ncbi:fasciclin domain-containing protein [Rhizobium lentis]|nr:fasciclin domain-containing protein [Rhizobium lentis]
MARPVAKIIKDKDKDEGVVHVVDNVLLPTM